MSFKPRLSESWNNSSQTVEHNPVATVVVANHTAGSAPEPELAEGDRSGDGMSISMDTEDDQDAVIEYLASLQRSAGDVEVMGDSDVDSWEDNDDYLSCPILQDAFAAAGVPYISYSAYTP